ncbi:hypothetical protein RHMOL_Rhmol07G0304300 [Rhododendron molle]|uniref:Uncharacterized protein n=1 Tax=Rhododendron molle TaxID=49168 RepID=A0ACC0N7G0_RHOML|nr:hypothetical protein RHMOL_Rhmol07G0304300 [Rhododendron molle]
MITLLSSSRTVELYVEHIGGVQFVETQLQPVQEDGLEFLNIDDGDVTQVESIQKVGDGDIDEPNSDQSTEEDQYSDGSYAMTDDDAFVQSSVGDGGSSSGVGKGTTTVVGRDRGKGTITVVGRGRGRSKGKGMSTRIGIGRETTSELERGTTSELGRGTISVQGKGSTTEDTRVECQFQATMVRTRGGGTAFLGRGGRIQWRGHEVNVPSNYAQATQSSQTAVGSNKSTTKCIFKGQKFGNLASAI